jgi:hypothetical protein
MLVSQIVERMGTSSANLFKLLSGQGKQATRLLRCRRLKDLKSAVLKMSPQGWLHCRQLEVVNAYKHTALLFQGFWQTCQSGTGGAENYHCFTSVPACYKKRAGFCKTSFRVSISLMAW